MVKDGEIEDTVAAATYTAFDQTRKRINVILVSDGISNSEAKKIGISATNNLDEAIATTLNNYSVNTKIGIITHGADIMRKCL